MSWTAAQRLMLREMGVPVFWPETGDAPSAQADAPVVVADAAHGNTAVAAVVPAAETPAAPRSERPHATPVQPAVAPTPASAGLRPLAASLPARPMAASADVVTLGQRPAGIEAMDWPALRTAVAGCTACGLCQSRKQAVFGVGHTSAHWMIVGEAPGEQEDKQGEPFVGRAGQLLDRMLAAVGLTRDDGDAAQQVFIANVLKCRPPANRNPLPQEVAQCEPYLLRQVELVQPKMILAMGRFAVQSLLKSSEPIGKLRGRVHTYHGVPLVVTYHPAYLLRSPTDKALAWDDLCLARATLAQSPR